MYLCTLTYFEQIYQKILLNYYVGFDCLFVPISYDSDCLHYTIAKESIVYVMHL